MYKIGELILYGRTGVCRVENIVDGSSAAGAPGQQYYTLQPLYQTCNITIPVNSKVFSRPIISRSEAEDLIRGMPEVEAEPYHNRNLNQLREHYRSCMESHCCLDLIRMTKSIYLKRKEALAQKKKFGAVDERFMKEAEDLLYGEFAAALCIGRDEVGAYISRALGAE